MCSRAVNDVVTWFTELTVAVTARQLCLWGGATLLEGRRLSRLSAVGW